MELTITTHDTDISFKVDKAGDDKSVSIKVKNSDWGYQGACDSLVEPEEWNQFIESLNELDRTLKGSAKFESSDAKIEFLSTDNRGGLGVKGEIGIGTFTLLFEPISIDNMDFPKIVKKFSEA